MVDLGVEGTGSRAYGRTSRTGTIHSAFILFFCMFILLMPFIKMTEFVA